MKKVSDEQDFCRGTGSLWRVLCGKHAWVGVWCTCLCECMMSESFKPCSTFLSKIVQPARPQHPPASAFPALRSEAHTTRRGFLTGVGDPSSGPYARTANTFPTEPSLQPPYQDSLPEHYQISLILKSHRDSDVNQFKKKIVGHCLILRWHMIPQITVQITPSWSVLILLKGEKNCPL